MARRVLLLMPTTTYRASDFLAAADRLDLEVVVGTDGSQTLVDVAPGHTLVLNFRHPEQSVRRIAELHATAELDAVVGVDDEAAVLAAMSAAALGLPHNSAASVRAARDKYETRQMLASAGLRVPSFRRVALEDAPQDVGRKVDYPCVLKPLDLSASRGVLRADDADAFVRAFETIRSILQMPDVRRRAGDATHLLVEDYLPGREVALEGLLDSGSLRVLALFDKPDLLEGPTFEESLFVTPSRLPRELQSAIASEAEVGCRALGLSEGPVHAELRLCRDLPWIIEIAPRTIGGLCSRALKFGIGVTLEELVLCHALRMETADHSRERCAAGVMMIPIPHGGVLRRIEGLDEACAVQGIEEVTLTAHRGAEIQPLPDGHRYLGFIFARGATPETVERALREAHGLLGVEIERLDRG